MKMWRLLVPALILGLTLFLEPATAQAAKRITMQNNSGRTIDVALVVQTSNGWRVRGWYAVAPYSYKTMNFDEAGGQAFGCYAEMRGSSTKWAGNNNAPVVTIVSNRMNHGVRQTPYGNNPKQVRVIMHQGNHVSFNPPQQQQQQRNTGWW